MNAHPAIPKDLPSTPPLVMEVAKGSDRSGRFLGPSRRRSPWVGMSIYLVAGVFLGLLLIMAMTLSRGGDPQSTSSASVVTDNVIHLHARDIGQSCWRGVTKEGPVRGSVSMEVGLDGKVRYALAASEHSTMRSCIESHVKAWEFLPQAKAQTMLMPFEVDRQ